MKKNSTMQVFSNEIFKEQKLTIGVDLGDRWSWLAPNDRRPQHTLPIDSRVPHAPPPARG
jgi:hypothetical protein